MGNFGDDGRTIWFCWSSRRHNNGWGQEVQQRRHCRRQQQLQQPRMLRDPQGREDYAVKCEETSCTGLHRVAKDVCYQGDIIHVFVISGVRECR